MPRPKTDKVNRKTARGIVVHNNAVLLMERKRIDSETGKELHYYSIPGGGIDAHELPEVAVVRELFEEMQIVVRPRQLVGKIQVGDTVHNYFICDYLSGEPKLSPTSPEALRNSKANYYLPCWVSRKEFDSCPIHPSYEPARKFINDWFDGKVTPKPGK